MGEPTNRTSLVTGVFFILAGTMFLLERLGVFELRLRVLAPALLIAIGVAVLLGGRGHRSSVGSRPDPSPDVPPPPVDAPPSG